MKEKIKEYYDSFYLGLGIIAGVMYTFLVMDFIGRLETYYPLSGLVNSLFNN